MFTDHVLTRFLAYIIMAEIIKRQKSLIINFLESKKAFVNTLKSLTDIQYANKIINIIKAF